MQGRVLSSIFYRSAGFAWRLIIRSNRQYVNPMPWPTQASDAEIAVVRDEDLLSYLQARFALLLRSLDAKRKHTPGN
jgi:hypothetical protein